MTDSLDRDAIHADASLHQIRQLWPDLVETLQPGTARRWHETASDPEKDAQRDRLAAVERREASDEAPGYTRAPLVVNTLDILISEQFALVELEEEVREKLGFSPLRGRTAPQACEWIASAIPALYDQPDLLEHVRAEAARSLRQVRAGIDDAEPVKLIKAPCPLCDSLSLRAFPEREVVVCINAACVCPDVDCSCRDGRRHRWGFSDWPWLAQQIGADLAANEGAA